MENLQVILDPMWATYVVLVLAVLGFMTNRVPLVIVALFVPLALWTTGVLPLTEALQGFSDPVVLFIAFLFVLSDALDATGITAWIGQQLERRSSLRGAGLLLAVMAAAAALSAVISINGAVAALLPVAVVAAGRSGVVPSRMLIPLAFAAGAGSLLTLTGTPVNIIVSEMAAESGGREFGYFEFALVGLPLVVVTALVVVAFGGRLLPQRSPERLTANTADPRERVRSWQERYPADLEAGRLFTGGEGVAEVIVAPHSRLIGRTVFPGETIGDGDLVVIALHRGGAPPTGPEAPAPTGELTLHTGDGVLIHGPWDALHRYTESSDVIAVEPSQSLQRGVPLGRGWRRCLAVLVGTIVLLATGVVPPVIAGLLAAGALVVLGVVSVPQGFRAVSWDTVILIAGLIPLSNAFVSSGAADEIASLVDRLTGGGSPHFALLVICVLTLILSQFISNVATVLVMAPVAVSFAQSLEVSVQPFMMALTVVGAAAFLTPIATPANLMVMQPGGYRFGDYWRLGLPLALVFLAAGVFYVPLIWPF
ncbi:SLC13 family permease [Arthrobacter sunyaminii]|uniref:SLC13 family permease n=1 Tax=Arthrobacter sunyaminii TaxID=2816859 RepID=UPI001F2994AF|nr:SLC13 family permease [Arthrobacter sunyaminii]